MWIKDWNEKREMGAAVGQQYGRPAVLIAALLLVLLTVFWGTPTALQAATPAEETVFLPLIHNGLGDETGRFQIALIDESGAWLISSLGTRKLLLTHDVLLDQTEDQLSLQVAPDGRHVAIRRTDGWAIYNQYSHLVAEKVGVGFALTWERGRDTLLLSQLGHGVDRFDLATRTLTPLLQTTDETNDHSPLWSADGTLLAFAHQEFGIHLYVTLIPNFDDTTLPYIGENRASGITNEKFVVLEEMESWHDQPITFHWANDQRGIVFAAKSTIHVRSLVDEQHATIQPTGFGDRETGRAVDLFDDRILYFAADGIYEVGLDGLTPRRIIEGDDLHYPQWAPEGSRLVYRGTDDQLYLANDDGSDNHVIPNTTNVLQFDLMKVPTGE